MAKWTKATLLSGQAIYIDLDKITAIKRVRGQGKDFTAAYCGANAQPFEITENPEELLELEPKPDA